MLRGTDTEVLLQQTATGKFISSIGLIGGTKEYPMDIGNGCALQEDNVTVEFNTPPTDKVEEFIASIRYNLSEITKRVAEIGLSVSVTASAEFTDDQLDNPHAQSFGCEPDFNAWRSGRPNPRPKAKNSNLRSAGGHLHFSVDKKEKVLQYVQACDLFIGVPLVLIDPDTRRRELYGKAGAYRPKPYGFEYRTPSNFWCSSEALIRWVWEQMDTAINFVDQGNDLSEDADRIQAAINTSDAAFVVQLMKKYNINEPH